MKKIIDKIKKFYQENRIFSILMLIVIVCFIIITISFFRYFFFGVSTSKYGDRLDSIKDIKISNTKINEIEKKLNDDDKIDNTSIDISGKIIYVYLNFIDGTTLDEAKGKAVLVLDELSDKIKLAYDIQFILKQNDKETGFVIMGAKNINNVNIVWNNNTSTEA